MCGLIVLRGLRVSVSPARNIYQGDKDSITT
jgi:hypothetical protein